MTNSSDTNRDKALRREVVVVTDARLREMQEQAIRFEGVGEGTYHWHWAAVMNELIARRASDEPLEQRNQAGTGGMPARNTSEGGQSAAEYSRPGCSECADHCTGDDDCDCECHFDENGKRRSQRT